MYKVTTIYNKRKPKEYLINDAKAANDAFIYNKKTAVKTVIVRRVK